MSLEEYTSLQRELDRHFNPEEGETWYFVEGEWLRTWHAYYRAQSEDAAMDTSSDGGKETNGCGLFPQAIPNEKLLKDVDDHYSVRRGLLEGVDYDLVPESVWTKLQQLYGGGPEIPRQAVRVPDGGKIIIELAPFRLQCVCQKEASFSVQRAETERVVVSKYTLIKELKKQIMKAFHISPSRRTRLWDALSDQPTFLADEDVSLEEARLIDQQNIILEVANDAGEWLRSEERATKPTENAVAVQRYNFSRGEPAGLVGLHNLGNTCFMNSALQCLSHTPELTSFFLTKQYRKEINPTNPIGTGGKLAKSYGELLKQLWEGSASSVTARDLKVVIGKLAPRFSGFGQQDAQELLGYLLDGLHEDLNRVLEKPYVEDPDEDEELTIPETEAAENSWERHRARNQSIIVDLFQGQLRSKVTCPVTGKSSITFDPFMYLSLPIPDTLDRRVTLLDCLEKYTEDEELGKNDLWRSPFCKKLVQAKKKFDLWKLPRYLIIHLKRFQFDRWHRNKIETYVEAPKVGLDLSDYAMGPQEVKPVYDLYGVSNHSGWLSGGHYTAMVKHADDGQWYYFNDSSVSRGRESDVVSAANYLLFYKRRDG